MCAESAINRNIGHFWLQKVWIWPFEAFFPPHLPKSSWNAWFQDDFCYLWECIASNSDCSENLAPNWPLLALFMDLNNSQTEDKLKNRYLHAEYKSEASVQSSNDEITKYQNFTLDCTLEEMSVHKEVKYSQSIPRPSVFPESALYPVIPVDA